MKKGLQTFTKSELRINKIFSKKEISLQDYNSLSKIEKTKLHEMINNELKTVEGEKADTLLKKIDVIMPNEYRRQLWECNHSKITAAISNLMQEYGRMPTQLEISNKTGISRQTISKHLQEYAKHPLYLSEVEQFKFMASKVLSKLFQFAVNGDTGAAKVYLKAVGALNESNPNTLIQNQNNFVQINGMVIKQETLMQLSPEQINTIETILKAIDIT